MLINAVEAREKSRTGISDKTEMQLMELEKIINNGVNKGDVLCFYYKKLTEQAKVELLKLGYKVKDYSSQKDGVIFQISW